MIDGEKIEFSVQQYRECYETWRQHVRFIWQIPTITVAIVGGLGVASFGYIQEWLYRGFLFTFGAILTFCLFYAVVKHRYFSEIEQETLCTIEELKGSKVIQRITWPQKREYWCTKLPKKWQKYSAEHWLIVGMVLITVLLFGLAIWSFYSACQDC